jgi:hypothetical protein
VKAEPNQRRRLELITDATRDVLRRGAPIAEMVPYRSLTVDRRWSDRRARAALIDVVARTLLNDA